MGSAPGTPRSRSTELRAGPRTPAEARSFLAAALDVLDVGDFGVDRDTVNLLTSELASNAARHGKEPIAISVSMAEEGLRVSVFDRGAGFDPEALKGGDVGAQPYAEGGWGLQVVDTLSSEWGVDRRDGGTEVWFRL